MPPSSDDALWAEALDLLIRLQADPANPVARETAERWLARGPAHRRVWEEAVALHELGGQALRERAFGESRPQVRPRLTRRRFLAGGGAALAAGLAGAVVLPGALTRARADVFTAVAERRRVTLPDGGFAELGPDTALRYEFEAGRRRVELLQGMAFFEPSAGQGAFEAVAGPLRAATTAGAFEIRSEAGVPTVTAARGETEVPGAAPLAPGDWCALGEGGLIERGRLPLDQVASWRQGMIFADSDRLGSVVERLARWMEARVVIADPGLARERISGVFDPSAPLAALEAAVSPLGGTARPLGPWLVVLSRL